MLHEIEMTSSERQLKERIKETIGIDIGVLKTVRVSSVTSHALMSDAIELRLRELAFQEKELEV